MQPLRTVACPRCGAPAAVGPENRWRPFCSERCRMIDLGQWAAEQYRVAGEEVDPNDAEPTPRPPGS